MNAMDTRTFESDGEYQIKGANHLYAENLSLSRINIISNDDDAVLVFGYKNSAGSFKAYDHPANSYKSGTITIDHGEGVYLMVSVTGISSNPVIIEIV